jgi:feruloyl esterase
LPPARVRRRRPTHRRTPRRRSRCRRTAASTASSTSAPGADGKSYGIGFALALPGDWNGRFLFQGGGGLNGNVGFPVGAQASGGTPALVRGFAVVSTDTGHQGGGFDASFMADQQASLDFAYQAVGRVAELAKQIIARHYAKPPDRSYFAAARRVAAKAC